MTEKAKPAKVDYEFRERLAKVIDGNRVATCYQCGACVGDCPSARYDESFNPREIMLKALYGLEDELLGKDSPIWNCSNCYTCTERCPQDVKPVEVIIALKNMLREAGRAPEGVEDLLEAIKTTGRTTIVTSATLRRRDALNLPPLLDPPVEELQVLVGRAEGLTEEHNPLPVHPRKEGVLSYAFFPGCLIPTRYPQMEASIRCTLPNLGIEIVDLPGFSCCPDPIFSKATDKLTWLTMAARNLAVAEEAGLELFTICSGCTATLSEALHMLREEPELKDAVNKELAKVGRKFHGDVNIRHIVTILRDEVGIDKVAASVKTPLDGHRIAVHYGCHLLKPSEIMCVDEPDDPTVLDDLMSAIGVTPVRHRERVLCCGKACRTSEDIPDKMLGDILDSALEVEAEVLGVICPSCFDVFDVGQLKLAKKTKRDRKLPAVYYFQLLALAQGLSPKDVGLDKHKVKAKSLLARAES